jgi:flavodoxin short chain
MNEKESVSSAIRIGIIFWSGMGNTERMAELIRQGAESSGAVVTLKNAADATAGELCEYDVTALGSPSICSSVEESEMAPFLREAAPLLVGRRVALFGSYGWGGGEWLRAWADEMRAAGAELLGEPLAVKESPEGAAAEHCVKWGRALAN